MGKDINIHVKTQGAQQTKQEIDGVSQSTQKLGQTTEQAGTKTSRASRWIMDGFKSIVGPLGFAAIATTLAATAGKIATFFDNLKTLCDEAVRNLLGVRKGFTDLFEAMDAFDEKSRKQVTQAVAALLKETSVSQQIGLPVINAYTRQYKGLVESGQITEEQYKQGLTGMLGYAERHGGAATTDLIALMAGWGITTPEQQGVMRRQIAAGAAASGLTDAELIESLGRAVPTAKAMGWTPADTISKIAALAAGETGRKRTSLPATTLESLINPQLTNAAKYGISETAAQDPRQLLTILQQKRGTMKQADFVRMLSDIYGGEAAVGVSKLISTPAGRYTGIMAKAATAEAAAAEIVEEQKSRGTMERRDARTKAAAMLTDLDITIAEQAEEDIREIGESRIKYYKRRRPVRQWFSELFTVGGEKEKEYAAFQYWYENLSAADREDFQNAWRGRPGTPFDVWQFGLTPEQRYEGLTTGRMPQTVNIHYHHDTNHYPRIGSDERGPRASTDLQ